MLSQRADGERIVGALLGTEGSHALDGELENIDRLYAAGFRMMGLQHFFDNRLGGSLHGESQTGLTRFGIDAVKKMHAMDVMIDVAHSSEATVRDTLAATGNGALIVSHTGFQGHCPSPRNISDETMALITQAGGLIGVGFWADVTCGEERDRDCRGDPLRCETLWRVAYRPGFRLGRFCHDAHRRRATAPPDPSAGRRRAP